MRIFFGKISGKIDTDQLVRGYYRAPKGSSWFNGVDVGDYVFLIGGGKIQLWQAREWSNLGTDNEQLDFNLLIEDLRLEVNDLVRFKYFKLTVDLIVKTTRSTGASKKAFYEIGYERDLSEAHLLSEDTYQSPLNFRKIYVLDDESKKETSPYDLVLHHSENRWELKLPQNSDPLLQDKFHPENFGLIGKGRMRKDKILATLKAQVSRGKDLSSEVRVMDLYDSLLCEYGKVTPSTNYWVVNGFQVSHIKYDVENSVFVMQFQYGEQYTSAVTTRLQSAQSIKEGDKVLLYTGNRYYAHGEFTKPELPFTKTGSLADQIKKGEINSEGEIVKYTDAPCYYEDLTIDNGFDGTFGQRLAVLEWEDYHENGIEIRGISNHTGMTQTTIIRLNDETFYDKVEGILSGKRDYSMNFEEARAKAHLLKSKFQIILQGPPGTGKTRQAKDIAEYALFGALSKDKKDQDEKLEASERFALVQFHPSYTYEDFVRGITVKAQKEKIIYETENRVLGQMAEDAEKSEETHVLIIDEINRANLPAVLGELIYSMEYRDEAVQGMYAIDKERKIILPKNLLIIGTMNTADRSVGHIDYAIRRRFAFVEMLPKKLDELGDNFHGNAFLKVSELFVKEVKESSIDLKASDHLSEEFSDRPQDVWIGHSYFIATKEDFKIKLKYEVVPILEEYIKDGILKSSAKQVVKKLLEEYG